MLNGFEIVKYITAGIYFDAIRWVYFPFFLPFRQINYACLIGLCI